MIRSGRLIATSINVINGTTTHRVLNPGDICLKASMIAFEFMVLALLSKGAGAVRILMSPPSGASPEMLKASLGATAAIYQHSPIKNKKRRKSPRSTQRTFYKMQTANCPPKPQGFTILQNGICARGKGEKEKKETGVGNRERLRCMVVLVLVNR